MKAQKEQKGFFEVYVMGVAVRKINEIKYYFAFILHGGKAVEKCSRV